MKNHPIVIFLRIAMAISIIFILILAFEPETLINCANSVVVDRYMNNNGVDQILVFNTGNSIETLNVEDEEYYRYAIGDTETLCNYRKTYSHLPLGYQWKR